jgi:hypothetical protein
VSSTGSEPCLPSQGGGGELAGWASGTMRTARRTSGHAHAGWAQRLLRHAPLQHHLVGAEHGQQVHALVRRIGGMAAVTGGAAAAACDGDARRRRKCNRVHFLEHANVGRVGRCMPLAAPAHWRLPAGGRRVPHFWNPPIRTLTWWRGRWSPSPTVPGGRSRGKAMDEAGWSHLPCSPLVSTREVFFRYPFSRCLGREGRRGFSRHPPQILPQALCLPGPSCRR